MLLISISGQKRLPREQRRIGGILAWADPSLSISAVVAMSPSPGWNRPPDLASGTRDVAGRHNDWPLYLLRRLRGEHENAIQYDDPMFSRPMMSSQFAGALGESDEADDSSRG